MRIGSVWPGKFPVKENMMDDMKDCWLSVEDICKSLGVSKDTF